MDVLACSHKWGPITESVTVQQSAGESWACRGAKKSGALRHGAQTLRGELEECQPPLGETGTNGLPAGWLKATAQLSGAKRFGESWSSVFSGMSGVTVLLVTNNAAQGILSSFFSKFADTILKKYSSTLATILTGIMSFFTHGDARKGGAGSKGSPQDGSNGGIEFTHSPSADHLHVDTTTAGATLTPSTMVDPPSRPGSVLPR